MNIMYFASNQHTRILRILTLVLILFFCFQSVAFAYTVGDGLNVYTVGSSQNIFTVGGMPDPPIDDYYAAKPILLIVPGLLLLAFVMIFGFMGFQQIKQAQLIVGLSYVTVAFILIGLAVMIGMPLIMSGVDATIWFK
jgi:ABC-type Na+ efflux pump permease subunit